MSTIAMYHEELWNITIEPSSLRACGVGCSWPSSVTRYILSNGNRQFL